MSMRPNRWVLLASFIVGAIGLWSYVTAIQDYRRTAGAYTSVDAEFIPGSFVWLDADYETAEADFVITNDSQADATVDFLILRLYFDGEFAGAQYRPWSPVDIPRGSEQVVTVPFESCYSGSAVSRSNSDVGCSRQHALGIRGDRAVINRGAKRAHWGGISRWQLRDGGTAIAN